MDTIIQIDSYNPTNGSLWVTLPKQKNIKGASAELCLRRYKKEKATYELIPKQGLASSLSGIEFCNLCSEVFNLLPDATTIRYYLSYSPSYVYWYTIKKTSTNASTDYYEQLLKAITVELGNPDYSEIRKG